MIQRWETSMVHVYVEMRLVLEENMLRQSHGNHDQGGLYQCSMQSFSRLSFVWYQKKGGFTRDNRADGELACCKETTPSTTRPRVDVAYLHTLSTRTYTCIMMSTMHLSKASVDTKSRAKTRDCGDHYT